MFVQFLASQDANGYDCFVNVADISCVLAVPGESGQFLTEICFRSDPKACLSAHGTPVSVMQGRIVTLPAPRVDP